MAGKKDEQQGMEQIDLGRIDVNPDKGHAQEPDPATTLQRIRSQAQSVAVMENLAVRERDEAARAEVPYDVWEQLPNQAKARLMMSGKPVKATAVVDLAEDKLRALERGAVDIDDITRQLIPEGKDRQRYVVMFDPPKQYSVHGKQQTFHPGTSVIARNQMQKKIDAGFSPYPLYDLLPAPSIPCGLNVVDEGVLLGGPACTLKFYTKGQVEKHMAIHHRTEYEAMTKRIASERDAEALREARASRRSTELLVNFLAKQVGGGGELPQLTDGDD